MNLEEAHPSGNGSSMVRSQDLVKNIFTFDAGTPLNSRNREIP